MALAKKGKIDAVVTTSRGGHEYLRTRPDTTTSNNLSMLG
ncbi:MAG: DUF3892 domain-containing protein [Oligoflexia bacterium]|nr:DUF3892 domain-containing protein [Oligoflexia bacterium]